MFVNAIHHAYKLRDMIQSKFAEVTIMQPFHQHITPNKKLLIPEELTFLAFSLTKLQSSGIDMFQDSYDL